MDYSKDGKIPGIDNKTKSPDSFGNYANMAGMLGESIFGDYKQELYNPPTQDYVDIPALMKQKYQRSFAGGDILRGASMGAMTGPQGALIGAGVGAASALIKTARQHFAEKQFMREQQKALKFGGMRNSALDFRDQVMNNFGQNSYTQYTNFYGT